MSQYARELSLIGEENFKKLRGASVAVFGIGGVGSYAAEALVRAGVGSLTFVDGDAVGMPARGYDDCRRIGIYTLF